VNNPEQLNRDCAAVAWVWLAKRYGLNGLVMPRFETSSRLMVGRYQVYKRLVRVPELKDGVQYFWATYPRKGVGRVAFRIYCTPLERRLLTFIHEFTHAIQHLIADRAGDEVDWSEIETTQNEMDFAKENLPHLYKLTTEV